MNYQKEMDELANALKVVYKVLQKMDAVAVAKEFAEPTGYVDVSEAYTVDNLWNFLEEDIILLKNFMEVIQTPIDDVTCPGDERLCSDMKP